MMPSPDHMPAPPQPASAAEAPVDLMGPLLAMLPTGIDLEIWLDRIEGRR